MRPASAVASVSSAVGAVFPEDSAILGTPGECGVAAANLLCGLVDIDCRLEPGTADLAIFGERPLVILSRLPPGRRAVGAAAAGSGRKCRVLVSGQQFGLSSIDIEVALALISAATEPICANACCSSAMACCGCARRPSMRAMLTSAWLSSRRYSAIFGSETASDRKKSRAACPCCSASSKRPKFASASAMSSSANASRCARSAFCGAARASVTSRPCSFI